MGALTGSGGSRQPVMRQQSGGPSNGMYSSQIAQRTSAGFTPQVPGLNLRPRNRGGMVPGGPQPAGSVAPPWVPPGNRDGSVDPVSGGFANLPAGWTEQDAANAYNNARAEAERSAISFAGGAGHFRGEEPPGVPLNPNSQSREDWINSTLRDQGWGPNREWLGAPSNYNPNAILWDDPENSPISPTSESSQLIRNAGVGPSTATYNPGGYSPGGYSSAPNQTGSYSDPTTSFLNSFGMGSLLSGQGGSASVAPTGIRQLSSSTLNGDIFGVPTSSQDYGGLRGLLQQYLSSNIGAGNAQVPGAPGRVNLGSAPTASSAGVGIQSADQLGAADSPFFLNMLNQYQPAFQAERERAIAEAREQSGNLVGSSYANNVGTAINRSLASQQATIASLINEQIGREQARQGELSGLAQTRNLADQNLAGQYGLNQGQLDQQRNLGIFDTTANVNNANAGRFASLLGQLGTAGVSPDEIVSQGGLGALIGPLLGALGNSSLGSGLANLGGSLVGGLGSLGGSLVSSLGSLGGSLGDLGGSLVGGLGKLAGGLGDLGGRLGGGLTELAASAFGAAKTGVGELYNAVKDVFGALADKVDISGIIDSIGRLPGIDKILDAIKNNLPTDISAITNLLKKIPGLENFNAGDAYNLAKTLAKIGIIRGTGGQILNALPGYKPPGGGTGGWGGPYGGYIPQTQGGYRPPGYGY